MSLPIQLVSGLGGAIGCDLRRAQNQLLFVEFNGKLSRLNLFRTATQVSAGNALLKGTWTFDLETGVEGGLGPTSDIWWEQQTAVLRRMTPWANAKIVNLGVVDFNSITPDTLSSLPYSSTPIIGNNDASNKLVTGDVFAVYTNQGDYAKVKVVAYGYNMQIQWVTYRLDSPYAVLGTGYNQPEDVKASADGSHAYVTERSGDLVKVQLINANRAAAQVICSGMTAPQQMFLDEVHNTAYVVEYAASGNLWKVNLTNGSKVAVLSNLPNAVGLLLTADLQYAYISEQTTGAEGGRVSRYQLSNGARQTIVKNLTAPFFLTWLDVAQSPALRSGAGSSESDQRGQRPGRDVTGHHHRPGESSIKRGDDHTGRAVDLLRSGDRAGRICASVSANRADLHGHWLCALRQSRSGGRTELGPGRYHRRSHLFLPGEKCAIRWHATDHDQLHARTR